MNSVRLKVYWSCKTEMVSYSTKLFLVMFWSRVVFLWRRVWVILSTMRSKNTFFSTFLLLHSIPHLFDWLVCVRVRVVCYCMPSLKVTKLPPRDKECLSWHGSARALPHYRFALPKKSCLRRLLWKQCSYIIHKSAFNVHIDPFLRYMWFEGRPSKSSWLGWAVDFREGVEGPKIFYFLFFIFCLPSSPPPSSFCINFTSVSLLWSTCPPCTPVLNVCVPYPLLPSRTAHVPALL